MYRLFSQRDVCIYFLGVPATAAGWMTDHRPWSVSLRPPSARYYLTATLSESSSAAVAVSVSSVSICRSSNPSFRPGLPDTDAVCEGPRATRCTLSPCGGAGVETFAGSRLCFLWLRRLPDHSLFICELTVSP